LARRRRVRGSENSDLWGANDFRVWDLLCTSLWVGFGLISYVVGCVIAAIGGEVLIPAFFVRISKTPSIITTRIFYRNELDSSFYSWSGISIK